MSCVKSDYSISSTSDFYNDMKLIGWQNDSTCIKLRMKNYKYHLKEWSIVEVSNCMLNSLIFKYDSLHDNSRVL